jgi:pimeloyl-ACP methyl ester carboxylesterase
VIVPGIDDLFRPTPPGRLAGLILAGGFLGPYRDAWTPWLVGRPRGIEATTTRELAAGYADALAAFDRPVDVIGLSMGGQIATHLAADHDVVDRLVLAVSAARLGPGGRALLRRWARLGDEGRWRRVRRESIRAVYGRPRRLAYPWLLPALGVVDRPPVLADIGRSCRACLAHDARDRLGAVDAPTLVVGGADDQFFPPDRVRETVAGLPDARGLVVPDAGHGLYEEQKRRFDRAVREFLDA